MTMTLFCLDWDIPTESEQARAGKGALDAGTSAAQNQVWKWIRGTVCHYSCIEWFYILTMKENDWVLA